MTKVALSNTHASWSNNRLLKCRRKSHSLGDSHVVHCEADFSERTRRRRPTFRSFTRRRRGRRSERANGDIRVSTLLLLLCCPPRPALLCLLASSRMRGVKRRQRPSLGWSQQESSPMTKWKVRPTDGTNAAAIRKQVQRWRLKREGRRRQAQLVGWARGMIEGSKTRVALSRVHFI